MTTTRRLDGYIHDRWDGRDAHFADLRYGISALPTEIDWRPQGPAIDDQGDLGDCTADAICRADRVAHALAGNALSGPLSRLWLYAQERWMEHTVGQDVGAMPRDGLRVARKVGIPPESDWPYDLTQWMVMPPQLLTEAQPARLKGFYRCGNPLEVKQALLYKHPVVMGFQVYESFMGPTAEVARTGVMSVPDLLGNEMRLGGHCVSIEGYADEGIADAPGGRLIVANSWGAGWGDAGFFYMPYEYLDPDLELVSDLWAVVV